MNTEPLLSVPAHIIPNKKYHIEIIKALPLMEEIDISMVNISADDTIQIVEGCKFFKKLCFRTGYNVDFDGLKARLGDKWQVESTNEQYEWYCIIVVKRHTQHHQFSTNFSVISNLQKK